MWVKEVCMLVDFRRKKKELARSKLLTNVDVSMLVKRYKTGDIEGFKKLVSELVSYENGNMIIGEKRFRYMISTAKDDNRVFSIFRYARENDVEEVKDPETIERIVFLKNAILNLNK
jgi:hypothetical protein